MKINYADLFLTQHPGFFEREYIRSLPMDHVFDEQVLALRDYSPDALQIDCPAHITFGHYTGDFTALQAAIREVDEDWVQYFNENDDVYCAFDGERVVSFCMLDNFGEYRGLRVGAPGCVGTVPAYRKQGIGLRMVQLATAELKAAGYDLSWIHYTHVGHWYARLGYRTVVRWNAGGIVNE